MLPRDSIVHSRQQGEPHARVLAGLLSHLVATHAKRLAAAARSDTCSHEQREARLRYTPYTVRLRAMHPLRAWKKGEETGGKGEGGREGEGEGRTGERRTGEDSTVSGGVKIVV